MPRPVVVEENESEKDEDVGGRGDQRKRKTEAEQSMESASSTFAEPEAEGLSLFTELKALMPEADLQQYREGGVAWDFFALRDDMRIMNP
eukprot:1703467-Amphidinium_carterae.6